MSYEPISTAPKDREIFVYVPSYGWRPANWSDRTGAWVSPVNHDYRYMGDDYPTHWMPVPPPPSDKGVNAVLARSVARMTAKLRFKGERA